jgi:hypothetical protein
MPTAKKRRRACTWERAEGLSGDVLNGSDAHRLIIVTDLVDTRAGPR